MNEKRPIRKKHDGWTLLDRAYELIEGEVFEDLDSIFLHHDVEEVEKQFDEFT